MRLTLRTLLAYLDDTLDPIQAREIGRKVTESESARELVERIKQVTRRRRLTTPEMAGSADVAVDPNAVAEYLDNVLTPEELGELEKLCLESDVNLAEVAACHQVLTVSVGEPAQVPPTAYQRMYAIPPGAEAIPHKQPKRRREPEPVSVGDGEVEEPLLLTAPGKGARTRGWLLAAAAAMFAVGLGLVLYYALFKPSPTASLARQLPALPPAPAERGNPVEPERTLADAPPSSPLLATGPMWAGWVGPLGPQAPEKPGVSLASVPMAAGWLAARPGMFGNWFLIFGQAEEAAAKPAPPPENPAPVQTPPPSSKPPNDAVLKLGTHSAANLQGSLLFRRNGDADWKLVRTQAGVESNVELLALPGYRSEITLENRAKLELVGSLPLTLPNYFLETAVLLHPASEVDIDVTLLRGRILVANAPDGIRTLRVRFLDQVWDVRLLEPKTEVGIELAGRVPPGVGNWTPHFRLNLITLGGKAELRRPEKVQTIEAGRLVPWDNSAGAKVELLQVPMSAAAPWMNRKTQSADDVRTATTRFAKRLTDKLNMGGSDVNWLKVACLESFEENKPWERAIASFCLGAMDQVQLVAKTLDTSMRPDVRVRAMDTLFHWLGRQPGQDVALRAALRGLDYEEAEVEIALRLFQGFDQSNRPVIDLLVGNLASPRLAIRELSYFSLHLHVQADKLAGYDPAAPSEYRDAAVKTIRTRLLGK